MKQSLQANSQFSIIIDGHNLAFYLHNFRVNHRLSQENAQALVDQLTIYQKSFPSPIPEIEICFVGGVRPVSSQPGKIRVLAAGPHNKANNLILDRFRFHSFSGHPYLVITNDAEIQEKLEQDSGSLFKRI